MRIYILALLALTSCIEQIEPAKEILVPPKASFPEQKIEEKVITEELSLKITDSEHGGYGFEILQGESTLIIQPHIPAIQGIMGFETEEQATIIGNYMIYKINNGIMPPSISIQDLDSLAIVY